MRKLLVLLLGLCAAACAQGQKVTVTGTLHRVMAIGGESTGWSIQLDSPLSIDDKQRDSIEVAYDNAKLEALNDQHVRATGMLSHRQGVETGTRPVLQLASIRVLNKTETAALAGSEWILEDLGASGVIDSAEATLEFGQDGRVAGRGTCNRFTGKVEITGNTIKFGPLASTRMMCPEALMDQESKYLKALDSAERFERRGSTLLIYSRDSEKPLKFTAKTAK